VAATPVSALTWPDYVVLAGSLGLLILALILSLPIGSLRADRALRTADR